MSSLPTKRSVVLVDDDRDIVRVLESALESNNYQVHGFDNPVEAKEYLKSVDSPQLLISDIRMPGMSGFELVHEANKVHPEMKIMMLTSFEINKSEFDSVFPSCRIDVLINKPVGIARFIDAVNAVMVHERILER